MSVANPLTNPHVSNAMQTYQIELTEEEANSLRKRAEKLGVPYIELLRSGIRELAILSDNEVKRLIRESVRRHEHALKRLA